MGSSVILPQPGQPTEGPDPNFKQGSVTNLVQFRFAHVDPPASLYIQRDDVLQVFGVSQLANEILTVTARVLLPYSQQPGQPDAPPESGVAGGPIVGPGYIQTFQRTLALGGALAEPQLSIPLLEGYLLSVVVTSALATFRGQTFARTVLIRGAGVIPTPNVFQTLVNAYVSVAQPVGWPSYKTEETTAGSGLIVPYTPANPAAGSDFVSLSNAVGRARLQSLRATLTTSATVANRFPSFFCRSSFGFNEYQVQATAAVPASTTVTYVLAPGGTNVTGGGSPAIITLPVPSPFFSRGTMTVGSSTQGIQAGDQWSAIGFITEEWFDAL